MNTPGGNDDGFSGKYSCLWEEGDNLVIEEPKGAGAIQQIWILKPTTDTLQFFSNRLNSPGIEFPFLDFLRQTLSV